MVTIGATATWGVTASCQGVSGIVTSVSISSEGLFLDEHNEENQVCGHYLYDMKGSVQISLQVGNTLDAPKVGEDIRIGSTKYVVNRVELIEGNTQFRKYSISGDAFPNVKGAEIAAKKFDKDWRDKMSGIADMSKIA